MTSTLPSPESMSEVSKVTLQAYIAKDIHRAQVYLGLFKLQLDIVRSSDLDSSA